MGQRYGQLSLEERVEIYRLHADGKSQNQIASALKRAPSTISRELRRNSQPSKVWKGGYKPVRAQQLAERRRRWDCRFKLARQPDLRSHVSKSLAMGHSPEQIAGRLARQHGRVIISHESIYRFIYHRTARTIGRRLGKLPRAMRKTLTFDNGTEFAEHHRLHKTLGVQTFFCDPHSPWQKGGVENSIGRLRRSLPRKTDLRLLTPADIERCVQRLNNTPRKCLDFQTPAEAFSKLKSTVALQT